MTVAAAVFAALVLGFAVTARWLGRVYVTAPIAFVAAGALTSLSQTLIKMTAPGVPDIYQGTEFYDLSLVDPDNRRTVDFAACAAAAATDDISITAMLADWRSGAVKAKLTLAGVAARVAAPTLYTKGAYIPLEVEGTAARHVVAFARVQDGKASITIAPRLCLSLLDGVDGLAPAAGQWADTAVVLPADLAGRTWRNALGRGDVAPADRLKLADLPDGLPFALLVAR